MFIFYLGLPHIINAQLLEIHENCIYKVNVTYLIVYCASSAPAKIVIDQAESKTWWYRSPITSWFAFCKFSLAPQSFENSTRPCSLLLYIKAKTMQLKLFQNWNIGMFKFGGLGYLQNHHTMLHLPNMWTFHMYKQSTSAIVTALGGRNYIWYPHMHVQSKVKQLV